MLANKHKRYLTGITYSIYKINHQKKTPKSEKERGGGDIEHVEKTQEGLKGKKKEGRKRLLFL